jgi:hypothetical protein
LETSPGKQFMRSHLIHYFSTVLHTCYPKQFWRLRSGGQQSKKDGKTPFEQKKAGYGGTLPVKAAIAGNSGQKARPCL